MTDTVMHPQPSAEAFADILDRVENPDNYENTVPESEQQAVAELRAEL